MPGGRPSDFSPELAELICSRIASGMSLVAICKADDMPHRDTVRVWLAKSDEFAAMYARAREDQADYYADEILAVADDPELDANDKRVRVDARKWVAAKLRPRVYGDKVDLTHQGPNGGPIAILASSDAAL